MQVRRLEHSTNTAARKLSRSAFRNLGLFGWFALVVLAGFLMASLWFTNYAWGLFPQADIGTGGMVAMVLAVIVSVAVGGGLMGLVFWSSRKGYDR